MPDRRIMSLVVSLSVGLSGVVMAAPAGAAAQPRWVTHAQRYSGGISGGVFLVATVLVGLCLVPAWFLPRKPQHAVDPAAASSMVA